MVSEVWEKITIGELIKQGVILAHKDGNHGSNYPRGHEFGDKGVPFLTAKLLSDSGTVDLLNAPKLNYGKASKIKFGYLEEGDVLLSHNATVGRVAVVPPLKEDVLIGTSLTHFRLDSTRLLPKYLAAYFKGRDFQNQLSAFMGGMSTRNQVPITAQRCLEVVVPPMKEQRAIASLLSTFEDKIQLNRQTNQTLEAMAQALFKSWFVDFDPVIDNALAAGNPIPDDLQDRAERRQTQRARPDHTPLPEDISNLFPNEFEHTETLGWVPKGWDIKPLSEITVELRRGISPKYLEEGGVCVVNQKCIRNHEVNFSLSRRNDSTLRKTEGRELEIGDLLINSTGVGTLGRMAQVKYLLEPTVVDSHVTVVRPIEGIFPKYAFGQLMLSLESYIESIGEGSTGQTELSRKMVSEQSVLVPNIECLLAIDLQLKNFAHESVLNIKQASTLEALRDTLLPKLISGELRIPEAQAQLEAVLG